MYSASSAASPVATSSGAAQTAPNNSNTRAAAAARSSDITLSRQSVTGAAGPPRRTRPVIRTPHSAPHARKMWAKPGMLARPPANATYSGSTTSGAHFSL